ncbi:MAG TPA: thioredoxin family protein [Nocardioides sp.]|nr:thioredoxin family protein [Nocardioides sp.]
MLVAAVVAALALGAWRASTNGVFRGTHPVGRVAGDAAPVSTSSTDGVSLLAGTSYDAQRGERATLLQFSSAFCAPCRATRRTLAEVADEVPGVTHVEIDAEHHLELVRALGVLRTPTTLVLDGDGRELVRATGAPRRAQVLSALAGGL